MLSSIHSCNRTAKAQGPVVQSIINLTCSLVVKMLTVLVSKISNSQVFLLKMGVALHFTFFGKNISVSTIFNDQIFNNTLTNDIVSFEPLYPDQIVGISRLSGAFVIRFCLCR